MIALAVAGAALLYHNWEIDRMEARHTKALSDQKTKLENDCAAQKTISETANAKLQNDNRTVADELAYYKRLRDRARDGLPASHQAADPARNGGYDGGGPTDAQLEYYARCKTIANELNTELDFVDEAWKLRGN